MSKQLRETLKLRKTVYVREAKEYLTEAIACFEAQAYRATVVMIACAVFEHLRVMTKELAEFDGSMSKLHEHIENQYILQKSYEQAVLDNLRKATFLDNAQKDYLRDLLRVRNNAAHASGVRVTPADAARLLEFGVNGFLSKPIQAGAQIVNPLLEKMRIKNLFPIDDLDYVDQIASQELGRIEAGTLNVFVKRLIEGQSSEGALFERNSVKLIQSMARRKDPKIRVALFRQLMVERTLASTSGWFCEVIAADPEILIPTEEKYDLVSIDEALADICGHLPFDQTGQELTDAMWIAILRVIEPAYLIAKYPKTLEALASRLWMHPSYLAGLGRDPALRTLLLNKLMMQILDEDHAESYLNMLMKEEIQVELANAIDDRSALEIVVAISRAAEASKTESVIQSRTGFFELDALREKAIAFLENETDRAWDVINVDDPVLSPENFYERHLEAKDLPWYLDDGAMEDRDEDVPSVGALRRPRLETQRPSLRRRFG